MKSRSSSAAGAQAPLESKSNKKKKVPVAPWDKESSVGSPKAPNLSQVSSPSSRHSPGAPSPSPLDGELPRPRATNQHRSSRPNPLLAPPSDVDRASIAAAQAAAAAAELEHGSVAPDRGSLSRSRSCSIGLRSPAVSRPNPLLVNSPTRRPASVGSRRSFDDTTSDIQLELAFDTPASASRSRGCSSEAPAAFLEQLLVNEEQASLRASSEKAPRSSPDSGQLDQQRKTTRRVAGSARRQPQTAALPALPPPPTSARASDQAEVQVKAAKTNASTAGRPASRNTKRAVTRRTGNADGQAALASPGADPASKPRSTSRKPSPSTLGKPVSNVQSAPRELAPWDMPDTPQQHNSPDAAQIPLPKAGSRLTGPAARRTHAPPKFGASPPVSSEETMVKALPSPQKELRSPDSDTRARSPSLMADGAEFGATRMSFKVFKSQKATDIPEPVKDGLLLSSAAFPAVGNAGSLVKKVPLSALASAPRPPLVVRLPRCRDLGGDWGDFSRDVVSPPPFLLLGGTHKTGAQVMEYKELCRELRSQRALGAQLIDMAALLRWYLPYLFFAAIYVGACAPIKLPEYAAFAALCIILITGLHALNLAWRDRLLLAAVDLGATADVRTQLRPPLGGWGDGDAIFASMLSQAMNEITIPRPQHGLLLGPPQRRFPRRSLALALCLILLLGITRGVRALLVEAGDDSFAGALAFGQDEHSVQITELVIAILAVLISVFFGCAPNLARPRTVEADARLASLEAAFGAMLDALRPLLAVAVRELPPSPGDSDICGGDASAMGADQWAKLLAETFSVRLLTSDRLTLRATAQVVIMNQQAALCISCPLADFTIVAPLIDQAVKTNLGRSAAAITELLSAPFDIGFSGNGMTSSLSLTSWAAALVSSRQGPRRGQQDDEVSISIMSASTASTLNRGGTGTRDEFALHFAMGTVTALGRRQCQPLEAFKLNPSVFTSRYCGVLPPKISDDEPSLLLSLGISGLRLDGGGEPPQDSKLSLCHRVCSRLATFLVRRLSRLSACCKRSRAPSKSANADHDDASALIRETHGVLRTAEELRLLTCSLLEAQSRRHTPASPTIPDSPPDSSVSVGSSDDESVGHRGCAGSYGLRANARRYQSPTRPHLSASGGNSTRSQPCHLALIFDTYKDRDRYHKLLQDVQLLRAEPR
eukprot:TRINITY_DN30309_c0_g1_i1.p1 TRINITY_DN30309_c0_g1~~TRINITY_DN30309_c0_g1_i1.p1  ORF type:complete len:1168 (-),score=137.41 TRINITY_DN30309_c0_g1_i1:506-4009(-)